MDKVNIYMYTTIKGPGTKSGTYTFLLEYITDRGPATLTKQGTLENVTEKQANLLMLTGALERLSKGCDVTVYTDSRYLQQGAETWIHKWRQSGWMTARNKPVANREEWEKAADLLGRHVTSFRVKADHSYRNWIQTETDKKEKEREECLKDSENLIQQQRSTKQQ